MCPEDSAGSEDMLEKEDFLYGSGSAGLMKVRGEAGSEW